MINNQEIVNLGRGMASGLDEMLTLMNDALLKTFKFSCEREKEDFIKLTSNYALDCSHREGMYLYGYDVQCIDPRFIPHIIGDLIE